MLNLKRYLSLSLLLVCFNVFSSVEKWHHLKAPITGINLGLCRYTTGFDLPQNIKILTINNSIPNGTVLHSWGYGSLLGAHSFSCTTLNRNIPVSDYLDFSFEYQTRTPGYFQTNNPGIGLKLYAKQKVIKNVSVPSQLTLPLSDIETMLSGDTKFKYSFHTVNVGTQGYSYLANDFLVQLEFRAELVKVGRISELPQESSLRVDYFFGDRAFFIYNSHDLYEQGELYEPATELGIKIIQPSCRLSAPSDYAVDLGSFRSVTSVPQYGDVKPIVIGLDCNGKPNNVDISFQDASGSYLSNGSVKLHDSSTGIPIEGLEAQMTYNGVPIMVNNSRVASNALAKINLGSLGQSQSQTVVSETFGVRFVQRGPITHVGPVKGAVNIFVTYN
ncbi:MAG: hypothetical protein KJ552_04580 [Gammaproteobacteria bacterium]|nr:hypothetical protein [Gammaproteobacteria bacterium]